jgi:hypothetical protein
MRYWDLETFNKSIEIAQKYYSDISKTTFNFVRKIGRLIPTNNLHYELLLLDQYYCYYLLILAHLKQHSN